VAECFHDYARMNALDEQQRCTCVAQVVEAHRWQVCSLEELVETVRLQSARRLPVSSPVLTTVVDNSAVTFRGLCDTKTTCRSTLLSTPDTPWHSLRRSGAGLIIGWSLVRSQPGAPMPSPFPASPCGKRFSAGGRALRPVHPLSLLWAPGQTTIAATPARSLLHLCTLLRLIPQRPFPTAVTAPGAVHRAQNAKELAKEAHVMLNDEAGRIGRSRAAWRCLAGSCRQIAQP
jgi:hypothetical protein